MIKSYCDICGAEIKNQDKVGRLQVAEKLHSLNPQVSISKEEIKTYELDICENCLHKIEDTINKIKKEKNNAESSKKGKLLEIQN